MIRLAWSLALTALAAVTLSPAQQRDERDDLDAGIHVGLGIDSFASSDLKTYLNPEDSGDVRERFVAGLQFSYRLVDLRRRDGFQLWVYGGTVHGVRSTDVDCAENPDLPVCEDLDLANAPERTVFIVRNATSLEGFLGARGEYPAFRRASSSPTNVFLEAQAGFLTVSDGADDVLDSHHLALGLIVVGGRFAGSRIGAGHGRSDVFLKNRTDRWQIDGYFTWRPALLGRAGISPFARMAVDVDLDDGSDSVQSFIGLAFDPGVLFGAGPG